MIIKNIDSKKDCSPSLINYLYGHLEHLASVFKRTPVYLVNEKTMEKIYPPEKRLDFNENCIRGREQETIIIKQIQKEGNTVRDIPYSEIEQELKAFTDTLEQCRTEVNTLTIALGVYLKEPEKLNVPFKPSVFICPERIDKNIEYTIKQGIYPSEEKNTLYNTLFTAVVLHELTHALFATTDEVYNTSWGKIIEETLCNASAFSTFNQTTEKGFLRRFHEKQPVSYKGYTYWLNNKRYLEKAMEFWTSFIEPDYGLSEEIFNYFPKQNHYLYQECVQELWRVFRHENNRLANLMDDFQSDVSMEKLPESGQKKWKHIKEQLRAMHYHYHDYYRIERLFRSFYLKRHRNDLDSLRRDPEQIFFLLSKQILEEACGI